MEFINDFLHLPLQIPNIYEQIECCNRHRAINRQPRYLRVWIKRCLSPGWGFELQESGAASGELHSKCCCANITTWCPSGCLTWSHPGNAYWALTSYFSCFPVFMVRLWVKRHTCSFPENLGKDTRHPQSHPSLSLSSVSPSPAQSDDCGWLNQSDLLELSLSAALLPHVHQNQCPWAWPLTSSAVLLHITSIQILSSAYEPSPPVSSPLTVDKDKQHGTWCMFIFLIGLFSCYKTGVWHHDWQLWLLCNWVKRLYGWDLSYLIFCLYVCAVGRSRNADHLYT